MASFQSLEKAAKRIRKILPWIPSEEVIIQFMSNLPECRPTERNILTIQHFISQHDKESVHEGDWLYEAFELRKLFPDMDEMIFYRSLSELGNIPNRLEIVVRQIINQPRPKDNAKRASTDISPQKNKIIKVNNNQWPNLEVKHLSININIKYRVSIVVLRLITSICPAFQGSAQHLAL